MIDKPILDILSINDDTTLTITTDGKKIIIEPVATKEPTRTKTKKVKVSTDNKIQKAYEKVVKKYAPALKKLAKN